MTDFLDPYGFLVPGIKDIIQILIVAAVFYYLLRLLARTRAFQMLIGLLVLGGAYFTARIVELDLIRELMETLFQYGIIAALIIFQPELRSALSSLGRNRMMRLFNRMEDSQLVDELVAAVERFARNKIGAIIAIEREVSLGEYVEKGTPLEARISAELLMAIFAPYGPLHDGAVLVQGDKIIGAGVILPLTQFPVADKSLGTRHRAALGLSEETDALIVVVSEETARVSIAQRGRLERDMTGERLRAALAGATAEHATAETAASAEQA